MRLWEGIMRPSAIIVAIILGLVAVGALTYFVDTFSDWNQQQACATAGGRNCQ
jgi:hypothetical protein